MRILITGGLGFIGVNLVESLIASGQHEITILDNESVGKRTDVDGMPIKIVIGVICDPKLVESLVRSCDAVVHLAANTGVINSVVDPAQDYRANVGGSFILLEAMRHLGKRRFVFASSGGAVLGQADLPFHETAPARPMSPYGASKLAIEGYLHAYRASFGLLPITFRFSNVYGPRSHHKQSVVAAIFRAYANGARIEVFGSGEQTRDFIYVKDLVAAIAKSLEVETTGVFQLASGCEISVNQLLRAMSRVVGADLFKHVDYRPKRRGEIERIVCDISAAQSELGFRPSTALENGLQATWDWFSAQSKASAPLSLSV